MKPFSVHSALVIALALSPACAIAQSGDGWRLTEPYVEVTQQSTIGNATISRGPSYVGANSRSDSYATTENFVASGGSIGGTVLLPYVWQGTANGWLLVSPFFALIQSSAGGTLESGFLVSNVPAGASLFADTSASCGAASGSRTRSVPARTGFGSNAWNQFYVSVVQNFTLGLPVASQCNTITPPHIPSSAYSQASAGASAVSFIPADLGD